MSAVHLVMHLSCSQSTFKVSHLQSASYWLHAVTELEPASAVQRLRRLGQLDGGVPQQSTAVLHSVTAHSRWVCVIWNVATVQMLTAPLGTGTHARPATQSFVTWHASPLSDDRAVVSLSLPQPFAATKATTMRLEAKAALARMIVPLRRAYHTGPHRHISSAGPGQA